MPVAVSSFLIPRNDADYFLLEDVHLRGGYRAVAFAADMMAISADKLKIGALCYVQADRQFFIYESSGSGSAWLPWTPTSQGSSVSSVHDEVELPAGWHMAVNGLGVKGFTAPAKEPRATLWLTSDIQVAAGEFKRLPFGDCEEDGQVFWDSRNPTRIQIVESGRYLVDSAICFFALSENAFFRQRMHLNGEEIPHDLTGRVSSYMTPSVTTGADLSSTSGVMTLRAGDYLELLAYSSVASIARNVKRSTYASIRCVA